MNPESLCHRAIVIEDDGRIRIAIKRALKPFDFSCELIGTVTPGWDASAYSYCRLVIVDFMVIQGFHLEILASIRRNLPRAEILLLSVQESMASEVGELGLDPNRCVHDPYDVGELTRKIGAIVRSLPEDAFQPADWHAPSSTPASKQAETPEIPPPGRAETPPAGPAATPSAGAALSQVTASGPLVLRPADRDEEPARSHQIIVVGSEKGGTGKSMIAMHLIASLLHENRTVGSLDLDARQGTLSRYLEYRRAETARGRLLPMPIHVAVDAGAGELARLEAGFEALSAGCDFIVVDTGGSDSALSRSAHALADTLITPLNDSFVDLDLLARSDSIGRIEPGPYAELVRVANEHKLRHGGRPIDWIVLRNRLSNLGSRNKTRMAEALAGLGAQLGFREGPGLCERVIYRELFQSGLTLADLRSGTKSGKLTMSHVAARQELRSLLSLIGSYRPTLAAWSPDGKALTA